MLPPEPIAPAAPVAPPEATAPPEPVLPPEAAAPPDPGAPPDALAPPDAGAPPLPLLFGAELAPQAPSASHAAQATENHRRETGEFLTTKPIATARIPAGQGNPADVMQRRSFVRPEHTAS